MSSSSSGGAVAGEQRRRRRGSGGGGGGAGSAGQCACGAGREHARMCGCACEQELAELAAMVTMAPARARAATSGHRDSGGHAERGTDACVYEGMQGRSSSSSCSTRGHGIRGERQQQLRRHRERPGAHGSANKRRERAAGARQGGTSAGTRKHARSNNTAQLNLEYAGALRARERHGSDAIYGRLHAMGRMGEGGALPSSPKDAKWSTETSWRRRSGALNLGAVLTERKMEAEDVEELVVRGTVVDVVEGDDDEEEEGHDRQGWEWPESTPATRRAPRCARDGAEAVDLVAKLTWKRRRRTRETLGEAGDKEWGLKRG